MTIEEKLGQLTQEYTSASRFEELEALAEKGEIGSLILAATPLAGDCEQEQLFLSKIQIIKITFIIFCICWYRSRIYRYRAYKHHRK